MKDFKSNKKPTS